MKSHLLAGLLICSSDSFLLLLAILILIVFIKDENAKQLIVTFGDSLWGGYLLFKQEICT